MCVRYELEYASPLVLLAVLGIFALERALAGQPVWRRAARCGWGLLLAFSVAFNLLLGLHLQARNSNAAWARLLQEKGRVDEAITHYRQALEIEPCNTSALSTWAAAFCKRAKWRRRRPNSKRRCKSSRTSRRPTTTWATR